MALNPWLAQKLKKVSLGPEILPLLVEVYSPQVMEEVKTRLGVISQVGRQAFNYIEVSAPVEAIPAIEALPGTKMVHKNMVRKILQSPLDIIPQLPGLLSSLKVSDYLEGEVGISSVKIPRNKITPHLLVPLPLRKALGFYGPLGDVTIIPTSKSREVLLDVPTDLTGKGVTAAVLDMGWAPLLPILRGKGYSACSTDPHPIDQGGHGCFTGNAFVFTQFCGLATLEEIWNKVEATPIPYKDGEAKYFSTKSLGLVDYLIPVDTNAIFKTSSPQGIQIETLFGTLPLATPWQEFLVVKPKKTVDNRNRLGKMDGHPRWYNGYTLELKRADEIKEGEFIFAPSFNELPPLSEEEWLFPYLVGNILGDSNIRPYDDKRHSEVGIHEGDPKLREGISARAAKLGYKTHYNGRNSMLIYSIDLKNRLKDLGIPSGKHRSRNFSLPRKLLKVYGAVRAFVAGYYDAEGNLGKKSNKPWFRLSSVNLGFLESLQKLLLCFGIYGYITRAGESKGSISYHLCFCGNNARDFAEFIRPYALKPVPIIPYKLETSNHGYVPLPTGKAVRVNDIKTVPSDDLPFYSLSIPQSHIYVASGVYARNTWCTTCLGGSSDQSPFGECLGIAPECNLIHVKVLHGLFGFGMTSDILSGIEKAVKEGAQVISMSLGGDTCEGGCTDPDGGPCPECKIINQLSKQGIIFAIAAGNSGTDPEGDWQIGCPGCAKGAITVGSVSITDYPKMAYWSSRGPSNVSNKDKKYELKPDVAGAGGGRASSKASPDEVLISGDEGWMQPLYTGMPDPHGGMHGTSQATPAVGGLLTLLLQAGKISSADDFKTVCAKKGHEKTIADGWGVPKLSWFL